ncbi:uncharacterized protein LOC131670975 [Phymastichus coffea]|uniref:uncharacterized protein LOC131670975 n=1 Tax=Phymastichus coffea TaxID=108790 RepID=UPI00273B974D|nr:uncharacterized protein LOC131670975 [Phymastichus coffea]XP_058803051.1 uncharacterized protein LOC131670975 [Phymastichus coffea]
MGFVHFAKFWCRTSRYAHRLFDGRNDKNPIQITFDNIKDYQIGTVVITGFIKQTFRVIRSHWNNMSYGSGSVCDAKTKININITNFTEVPPTYVLGANVTITGELCVNGALTIITYSDINSIVLNVEIEPMSPQQLETVI